MKCERCGVCCRLFYINLNEAEYRSGRYLTQFGKAQAGDDWREVVTVGANLLATKPDGSCIYLEENRCGIHADRPQVCREFFCQSQETRFQKMIRKIKKAKNQMRNGSGIEAE